MRIPMTVLGLLPAQVFLYYLQNNLSVEVAGTLYGNVLIVALAGAIISSPLMTYCSGRFGRPATLTACLGGVGSLFFVAFFVPFDQLPALIYVVAPFLGLCLSLPCIPWWRIESCTRALPLLTCASCSKHQPLLARAVMITQPILFSSERDGTCGAISALSLRSPQKYSEALRSLRHQQLITAHHSCSLTSRPLEPRRVRRRRARLDARRYHRLRRAPTRAAQRGYVLDGRNQRAAARRGHPGRRHHVDGTRRFLQPRWLRVRLRRLM